VRGGAGVLCGGDGDVVARTQAQVVDGVEVGAFDGDVLPAGDADAASTQVATLRPVFSIHAISNQEVIKLNLPPSQLRKLFFRNSQLLCPSCKFAGYVVNNKTRFRSIRLPSISVNGGLSIDSRC